MLWEKDKLRPTQPYFVFNTDEFVQEVYLKQGISHFYSFKMERDNKLCVVPDGCIDLFFEYEDDKMRAYACGTKLVYCEEKRNYTQDVFGVRFMPAVQPEMLNVTMKDLLNNVIPLESVIKGDGQWLKELEQEKDFFQRIRIFLDYYTKQEKKKEKPFGKKELVWSVKSMVYASDGKIKVSEMKERTGYSDRYINKVFIEEMGFSPKTFCKIIQFQRALEFLNYGAPDKMTDAAVFLGYYDQSQFIRDFTKYAGITPRRYVKMMEKEKYKEKIRDNSIFDF